MAPPRKRTAYLKDVKQILSARLPDLKIATKKTVSSAIRAVDIVAPIRLWQNFEMEVRIAVESANLGQKFLHHELAGPSSATSGSRISEEHYLCSNESDVQARFNQNVSNVLTAIFEAEGIPCQFSSGNSTTTNCGGIPDVILLNVNGTDARVVGELKTPWVHSLIEVILDSSLRRRYLGMLVVHV
ncbi:hypothetical protein DTO045G8_7214 [Paecilomyces variotii]|nr:hypothetical protein DTO045G8_7214 [Paecilomyces variotii]